jgi:D-3-phosphoglycerate dehydrogenase
MDEDVNIINAEVLLREHGIRLSEETQTAAGVFTSSVTAALSCEDQTYTASGTLFGNNLPRLIILGEYQLEAYLDGNLLVFSYDDVPGVIGAVGTIFGSHGVNIAQMSVGRESEKPGGTAVGVLNLDSLPSQAAIDQVAAHSRVHNVKVIQLPAKDEWPSWL